MIDGLSIRQFDDVAFLCIDGRCSCCDMAIGCALPLFAVRATFARPLLLGGHMLCPKCSTQGCVIQGFEALIGAIARPVEAVGWQRIG